MIPLKDRHFLDHDAGINVDSHNLILNDDEILDARNVYTHGGAFYSRKGFRQLGQSFANDLHTTFPYKNSDGASYLLGVDSVGNLKALLSPPKKLFTVGETGTGGNFVTGETYRFAITFVDFDLRESPFSEIIEFTPENDATSLDLSSIPVGPPNIFYKKIYRTLGNGGVFYGSDTTRIGNDVTTYTDNRDDATVGALTPRQPLGRLPA